MHPACPATPSGQPLVFDQLGAGATLSAIPWRQQLYVQLLGLSAYQAGQEFVRQSQGKAKPGAAGGGGAGGKPGQADVMKQLMRSRLPPTAYFVEQLVEGVLKPDTYATIEDPFGEESEDEGAEEFRHL